MNVRGKLLAVVAASSVATLGAVQIPAGNASASATATYSCRLTLLGKMYSYRSAATVNGRPGSGSYSPGAAVKFTSWSTKLVVLPAIVVDELIKHASTISGKVTTFNIAASPGLSPKTVNAARGGISFGTITLVANDAAVSEIPSSPKTVSGWTANSKRGTFKMQTGTLAISVDATIDAKQVVIPVTCDPDPSVMIGFSSVS
jgi:hypothetical protein